VLGLTFKEDCPDLRNSRVPDIVAELKAYGCQVAVHDPLAGVDEARLEYGIELTGQAALAPAQAVVLAVPHAAYRAMAPSALRALLSEEGLLIDVKGVVDRDAAAAENLPLWRL
jgi:UDP-N-acetyl-D-galactosamine dehydrogenase